MAPNCYFFLLTKNITHIFRENEICWNTGRKVVFYLKLIFNKHLDSYWEFSVMENHCPLAVKFNYENKLKQLLFSKI